MFSSLNDYKKKKKCLLFGEFLLAVFGRADTDVKLVGINGVTFTLMFKILFVFGAASVIILFEKQS